MAPEIQDQYQFVELRSSTPLPPKEDAAWTELLGADIIVEAVTEDIVAYRMNEEGENIAVYSRHLVVKDPPTTESKRAKVNGVDVSLNVLPLADLIGGLLLEEEDGDDGDLPLDQEAKNMLQELAAAFLIPDTDEEKRQRLEAFASRVMQNKSVQKRATVIASFAEQVLKFVGKKAMQEGWVWAFGRTKLSSLFTELSDEQFGQINEHVAKTVATVVVTAVDVVQGAVAVVQINAAVAECLDLCSPLLAHLRAVVTMSGKVVQYSKALAAVPSNDVDFEAVLDLSDKVFVAASACIDRITALIEKQLPSVMRKIKYFVEKTDKISKAARARTLANLTLLAVNIAGNFGNISDLAHGRSLDLENSVGMVCASVQGIAHVLAAGTNAAASFKAKKAMKFCRASMAVCGKLVAGLEIHLDNLNTVGSKADAACAAAEEKNKALVKRAIDGFKIQVEVLETSHSKLERLTSEFGDIIEAQTSS